MYIQEIIVDGFKSYAQKTVISGFDPQFNAITGLNGTGKSNILDSICFVLGISNLSQVRVGNLQELVYKQGQAGITKASVTLIFNNSDITSSPVGYESSKQITVTRQVVIGGKNKYMINGHVVQQSQVQNLFHSVQLNVNNPHFLIMQGRITKVLNMKPPEILSMVEEAAGTRMFETKKQAALKTLDKKQLKVDEISKCINEEITPTLESLRNERKDFHAWQANNSEFERLDRFCTAYEYCEAGKKIETSEIDKKRLSDELSGLENIQIEKKEQANDCDKKIKELEAVRNNEVKVALQGLKKQESELSKEVVRISSLLSNQKENRLTEEDALKSLHSQYISTQGEIDNKNSELLEISDKIASKEVEVENAEIEYSSARERYQNACAGLTDENNSELLSIPQQIATWEKREREASSVVLQNKQKISHSNKNLRDLEKKLKLEEKTHSLVLKESASLKKDVSIIENDIVKLAFKEEEETNLEKMATELKKSISQLKDQSNSISASLEASLSFDFKNPTKDFDRSKVKGLVARLISVNDPKANTALEIVAGSKLYQVIVDSEYTGKQLLQNGGLKKRVTILPLNKITARRTDNKKVLRAKEIAKGLGGTANLAIELVGYDNELQKAMEYVFGSTIICENSEIAKAIAFDKNVKNKTVTLDGDSYDPAGTLTGGSKNQIGALLKKLEEAANLMEKICNQEEELAQILCSQKSLSEKSSAYRKLKSQLELKRHELGLCEEKISQSTYAETQNDIENVNKIIFELEEEIKLSIDKQSRAAAELKKLKDVDKNAKSNKEKVMKGMENEIKVSQKKLNDTKSQILKLKARKEAITTEIKNLEKELQLMKEQISKYELNLENMTQEESELITKSEVVKSQYEEIKAEIEEINKELVQSSKEIKALQLLFEKCQKDSQNASLESRKITHKLKQWEKDFKDSSKLVNSIIRQNPWIEKEKGYFGHPGSDFDFSSKDIKQSLKRRKELKEEQERLAKKINKKVMGMIETAENEYEELNRKKSVILNDKAKIEDVIKELDVKKSQAIQTTWSKVNKDFGSIFSMLLPGAQAKLEPPENATVNEGLEVKVAFNNVWKESLTELSGGQRSLLALSLILSMLLFKPAPMYILDEVDAALDLSHTQNIGMMLRTHFSSSQFIVVSLKEGMFNNANVVFRTKFVDGISTVMRTVNGGRQKALLPSSNDENNEEEEDLFYEAPTKKKGKVSKVSRNANSKSSQLNL